VSVLEEINELYKSRLADYRETVEHFTHDKDVIATAKDIRYGSACLVAMASEYASDLFIYTYLKLDIERTDIGEVGDLLIKADKKYLLDNKLTSKGTHTIGPYEHEAIVYVTKFNDLWYKKSSTSGRLNRYWDDMFILSLRCDESFDPLSITYNGIFPSVLQTWHESKHDEDNYYCVLDHMKGKI
jgi:hypothetical protein